MKFHTFLKALVIFAFAGLAASCEPPQQETKIPSIATGTVAYVKISGHHYKAEATYSENGYVLWNYSWKKQPIFKFKSYRGMMTVYSEEEGFKSWNKFDKSILDAMFPIKVGKEASLEGMHHSEKEGFDYPFWTTITVREESFIKIKEHEYEVFIIDFSIIEEHPDGPKNYIKTIWFSPEIEISLKTEYIMENEIFTMRIVSLDEPDNFEDNEEDEPRGLGTVRL